MKDFFLPQPLTDCFYINAAWYVMSSILLLLFQVSSISHVLAFALQYKHYFLLFWWSFNYFHCFGAKLCRCFHFHHPCHSCILLVQTVRRIIVESGSIGLPCPKKTLVSVRIDEDQPTRSEDRGRRIQNNLEGKEQHDVREERLCMFELICQRIKMPVQIEKGKDHHELSTGQKYIHECSLLPCLFEIFQ